LCPSLLNALAHAIKDNRMTRRRVGADEEESVGKLDVFVAGWRAIAPQRQAHPAGRAAHAQTAVAIHVIRAKATLGEFVEEILRLSRELPGKIKRDRLRAMTLKD